MVKSGTDISSRWPLKHKDHQKYLCFILNIMEEERSVKYLRRQSVYNARKILEEQSKYLMSLSESIKESLTLYTTKEYVRLNGYMRGILDHPDPKLIQDVSNIRKAFLNVPPLRQSIEVYRGQHDKTFDTRSAISTTVHMDSALHFINNMTNCCLYKFTVTPGSRVLPLYNISDAPDEEEILLEMNGLFDTTHTSMESVPYSKTSRGSEMLTVIYITYRPPQSLPVTNSKEIEQVVGPKRDIPEEKLIALYVDNIKDTGEDMYDLGFDECLQIVYHQLKLLFPSLTYPTNSMITKIKKGL
jgi:hypothetical protein